MRAKQIINLGGGFSNKSPSKRFFRVKRACSYNNDHAKIYPQKEKSDDCV